jgi:hypothetical protein
MIVMAKTGDEADDFEFDPDQLNEIGELAEAFIQKELDTELMANLDREYLNDLVDSMGTEQSSEIAPEEYEAAVEVAELILDRMDATDQ